MTVNPLVNWIWFGFAVMALGTGIALLPESAFAFAVAKIPGGAATTALLLVLLVLTSNGAGCWRTAWSARRKLPTL